MVDLSSYKTSSTLIRFRLRDRNGDGGADGWYIDDVEIKELGKSLYYCDSDKDGYISSQPSGSCTGAGCVPAGCQTTPGNDCNDNDPNTHLCICSSVCTDNDHDGYSPDGGSCGPIDCNDSNPLEHPNQTWYQDVDGDGYSSGNMIVQCSRPVGYKAASELIATSGDCNDNNPNIHPGATEVCNGVDDNCNGQIDEGGVCGVPDLLVSAWTAPANACAGANISIKDTTKNQGTGTAGASQTCFYFSTNTTIDAGDTKLGCRNVTSLAPGGISTGTLPPVTLPNVPTGKYYLIAMADDGKVVTETNETNNKKTKVIYIGPDLIVSALTAPTSAARGTTIAITDTTKNKGCAENQPTTTAFYLSTNTKLEKGTDIPLGSRTVPPLGTGASNKSVPPTNVTIPAGIPPGIYYIIANSDDTNAVVEANETNNKMTKKITIN